MKKHLVPCIALFCIALQANAQETTQTASANDYLDANKKTDATLVFNTNDEGVKTPVLWGLDTAWPDEWNMRRGTTFIGKENLGVCRVSFQPSDLIGDDGQLSAEQKADLDNRLRLVGFSGVKDLALNCDHEVLCDGDDDTEEWKQKAAQHRKNYKGKPAEWVKLFKATVDYCRAKGFNVVSIAPFNEADYTAWNQGTMANFKEICRLTQADPYFEGIRISGGNTLNCDEALKWYNGLSPYINEGNTHQLAGSFDNYAKFFTTVRANGHYATADELHNVMEAMVGVEYGMQTGIWWGFDGRARGEFCRATFGDRLVYAEDRAHWTSASVYRMPDGRIQAFGGTSERQANNSSYRFVSQDKVAYFDGYGPMHEYIMDLPGGTGYQNGQTNAERVLEIHTGEDVPLAPINGTYIIMNKNSKFLLMPQNGATSRGTKICQGRKASGKAYQQWNVTPVDSRSGGDFSYFHISNAGASTTLSMNVLNGNLNSGGEIILYNAGDNLEQWYFQYAGDGYYYIISRHSGLCLEVPGGSTTNGATIAQSVINGTDQQQWRLLPVDADCEKTRPTAPSNVKATPTGSTIALSWDASTSKDIAGYAILRATSPDGEWNTIARNITGTTFVDNTVTQGQTYEYKVRAIDYSQNRSNRNEEIVSACTTGEHELVVSYSFENSLNDQTDHLMHCVHYGKVNYATGKVDSYALKLNGTSNFVQLPTAIAHREEMTISLWLKWYSGSKWQRIFDFGNGEQQYMFLTASADNGMMRLAAKNGGDEQKMDICKLKTNYTWQHIVITISQDSVVAYVDGQKQAMSTDMTIRTADFKPVLNYIGRSQFASDPFLKADIDDVRVYNFSLSADDVENLYQGKEVEIDTPIEEVSATNATITSTRYYTLDGKCHDVPQQGINIVRTEYSDGSATMEKRWIP